MSGFFVVSFDSFFIQKIKKSKRSAFLFSFLFQILDPVSKVPTYKQEWFHISMITSILKIEI